MADVVDTATRSRMMSGIRGKDTQPEMRLRRALHARGFRFRLHDRSLPGSPDLVLPRWQAIIQVHGCFWHRHAGCRYATSPASRPEFWQTKFDANVARDRASISALQRGGWRTAIIWECGLRSADQTELFDTLEQWLRGKNKSLELPVL
ncbi:very short patch repair endonuclease [Rhizorhabdus histidinilytica]|uniref:very short patch repair endonuclease n=1 Tax=Rhizorhabdus histidinilytica TaxID=439228 RepID=UPI0009A7AE78|nr:DNA mismatch endonuclease Vsr [Rhizorhabdus histidinilytica]